MTIVDAHASGERGLLFDLKRTTFSAFPKLREVRAFCPLGIHAVVEAVVQSKPPHIHIETQIVSLAEPICAVLQGLTVDVGGGSNLREWGIRFAQHRT